MILTEEKAAFAAEHHGVITQYLKEDYPPMNTTIPLYSRFWIALYPAKTILKSAHMRRWTERLRQ